MRAFCIAVCECGLHPELTCSYAVYNTVYHGCFYVASLWQWSCCVTRVQ